VIGVLVSGEGSNLQALLDAGLPVVAVASNRTDARALQRAAAAGVPSAAFVLEDHPTRDARDAAMADWLEAGQVDLVVCAGYMHLLTPSFLDRFPGRVVNTHSAPLPEFPGAHPIEDVLAAGVGETAATVHYVDEGIDTGAVIASERVPVLPGDDVAALRARVQAVEHRLLPRVVQELIADPRRPGSPLGVRGRSAQYGNTGPESTARPAAAGGGGAGHRPAGADADLDGEA
jgi:phosphoribosylglycinamide formyltransferase 1